MNNTTQYHYVMEESKQRALLEAVSELRLGDLRADAIRRLGAPSHDRLDVTKDGKVLGRHAVYYLRVWQKGLVNEKHDRYIRLEFDINDQLTKIIRKLAESP